MAVVMDASALLTLFQQEPGAEQVAEHMGEAVVSAVNLTEVIAKLSERGISETMIRQHLAGLERQTVPFDAEQAYLAGLLRPRTRPLGLSLGDRSCLALALKLGAPVLTADHRWQELSLGLEILVFR